MYYSTKYYGHDRGLSCCFRQWRATHSHCSLLHGYSLSFKVVFESATLDDKNWVMDFGGLKKFKAWLDHMFDHTWLIAEDDPHKEAFQKMAELGVADIREVPATGCEAIAKLAFDKMSEILEELKKENNDRYPVNPDVRVYSVEVAEHAGNSAIYSAR